MMARWTLPLRPDGVLMMAWINREAPRTHAGDRVHALLEPFAREEAVAQRRVERPPAGGGRLVQGTATATRLLFTVRQQGGACHTGYESCFFQRLNRDGSAAPVEEEPLFDADEVYHKVGN